MDGWWQRRMLCIRHRRGRSLLCTSSDGKQFAIAQHTFCSSMGISSPCSPQSSSYLHLFFFAPSSAAAGPAGMRARALELGGGRISA